MAFILFERHTLLRAALFAAIALFLPHLTYAQDLVPRAYVITPMRSNAVTLSASFLHGGLDFNGVIPVENATGTFSVETISYYRSFGLFGRSANIAAWLPYGVGTFKGDVSGQARETYRSGLLDTGFRLAVNLKGGPAMPVRQFVTWRQGVLLGASLKVIAPTGQYSSQRLINWGTNRWSFKPEFGYSQRWGNWIVDGYVGVWLFTTNSEFFSMPTPQPQTQSPIGSVEGHLSYNLSPFLWVSFDGNFWYGGKTSLGGVPNPSTRQTASRLGITASLPLTRKQTLRLGYNDGAYSRFGANYKNLSIGWQYAWVEDPEIDSQCRVRQRGWPLEGLEAVKLFALFQNLAAREKPAPPVTPSDRSFHEMSCVLDPAPLYTQFDLALFSLQVFKLLPLAQTGSCGLSLALVLADSERHDD